VDCPFNANCTGNAVINKRDTWCEARLMLLVSCSAEF
jgi:hypothetical protein